MHTNSTIFVLLKQTILTHTITSIALNITIPQTHHTHNKNITKKQTAQPDTINKQSIQTHTLLATRYISNNTQYKQQRYSNHSVKNTILIKHTKYNKHSTTQHNIKQTMLKHTLQKTQHKENTIIRPHH